MFGKSFLLGYVRGQDDQLRLAQLTQQRDVLEHHSWSAVLQQNDERERFSLQRFGDFVDATAKFALLRWLLCLDG